MKTLQELYNEVIASEELKKEYIESAKDGKALDFIKSHGVDTTEDEVKEFFKGFAKNDKELTENELENAAGGTCNSATGVETLLSVFSAGIGCAVFAVITYANSKDWLERKENNQYTLHLGGHLGQQYEQDGRLCNECGGGSILE